MLISGVKIDSFRLLIFFVWVLVVRKLQGLSRFAESNSKSSRDGLGSKREGALGEISE